MTPFDRKKAAEFFIVAWVKDWKMLTYLEVIGAKNVNYDDVHELYPWMPEGKNIHRIISNSAIKPWTAFAMKAINDKLFDAKDNKQRLALAKLIENWDSTGAVNGFSHNEAVKERTKEIRHMKQRAFEHKVSVELMRRGRGHHWNVVK
jgi:Fe-S cluster biosynthesis and repair protein YggX